MKNFEVIYTKYFREVFSFAVSLSHNRETADEITQETFYRALEGIDRFRGQSSLSSWLKGIAKNCWLERLRKQKGLESTENIPETADMANLEQRLIDRDQSLRIHILLHQLKEPYREVFHLRIFSELSFQTIGSLFGKSDGWARVTFYRAKAKLLEQLKEGEV